MISKRIFLLFSVLAALLLAGTPHLAISGVGSQFEIDGNAIENSFDDWDTVLAPGSSAFYFTGIKADPAPISIFTGGRKDIQLIDDWAHKSGSVPDKDDITNAYAAAYNDGGELVVYFGADRISNVGDAYLGFWFFKDAVEAIGGGEFIGEHKIGDTLVLVNFPQAAKAKPLIQVVEWVGNACRKADSSKPVVGDCVAKNLILRATGTGTNGGNLVCNSANTVCAITNSGTVDAPWPYDSKDGFHNEFPFETFFEGGINLTQVIGGDTCFSSFMAETRSSSSFTAALKDFVLGSFETCDIEVSKTCTNPRLNVAENLIIYDISGSVTNNGFGTVYNVTVTDTPSFNEGARDLGSIDSGNSAPYSGTITVPLSQNGLDDRIDVTATTSSSGGSTLTADITATCPTLEVSPEISITKNCNTLIAIEGGLVAAKVMISGSVCNTGDTRVDNVTVTDDKASGYLLSGVSLIAPDDPDNPEATDGACSDYSGSYFPNEALDSLGIDTDDPNAVVFKDTATVTAVDIFGDPVLIRDNNGDPVLGSDGWPVPISDMAACPLCTCPPCN